MEKLILIEEDTYIDYRDEKILENIEKKQKTLIENQTDLGLIKVVKNKIGKLLLFDYTYQGGHINYKTFSGGLPYTRYYHLSNVINNNIKKILILGIGSGSTIIDCLNIYKNAKIDALDINQTVIDIAYTHFNMPQNVNLNIFCSDAREFIFNTKNTYDLIIHDVFLSKGMPLSLMTDKFISQTYNILNTDGIFGINLFGTDSIIGEENNIFWAEYKTIKTFFESVYIFPTLFGSFEFYRLALNLKYRIGNLSNIILLASKNNKTIPKQDFINRTQELHKTTRLNYLINSPYYAKDYFEVNNKVDLKKFKIIEEKLLKESTCNSKNILNYIIS